MENERAQLVSESSYSEAVPAARLSLVTWLLLVIAWGVVSSSLVGSTALTIPGSAHARGIWPGKSYTVLEIISRSFDVAFRQLGVPEILFLVAYACFVASPGLMVLQGGRLGRRMRIILASLILLIWPTLPMQFQGEEWNRRWPLTAFEIGLTLAVVAVLLRSPSAHSSVLHALKSRLLFETIAILEGAIIGLLGGAITSLILNTVIPSGSDFQNWGRSIVLVLLVFPSLIIGGTFLGASLLRTIVQGKIYHATYR